MEAVNETNDEDRGPAILTAILFTTALSTILTCCRLFVRAKFKRRLLLDDYLVIVSVLCTWLTIALQFRAVDSGNGRHVWTLTEEQRAGVLKWTLVGFAPGILSFALPKLAIVALLTQALRPSRKHVVFLWSLSGLCLLQLCVTIAALYGQCHEGESQAFGDRCIDPWLNINLDIYTGAFSAFVDLYLAIYPSIVLSRLRMGLQKRIALSTALGFGFVSSIIATYKCTRIPSLGSEDFSFDSSDLVIWTCVEGSTIIIASCIPVLKPLIDSIRHHHAEYQRRRRAWGRDLRFRQGNGNNAPSAGSSSRQYQHHDHNSRRYWCPHRRQLGATPICPYCNGNGGGDNNNNSSNPNSPHHTPNTPNKAPIPGWGTMNLLALSGSDTLITANSTSEAAATTTTTTTKKKYQPILVPTLPHQTVVEEEQEEEVELRPVDNNHHKQQQKQQQKKKKNQKREEKEKERQDTSTHHTFPRSSSSSSSSSSSFSSSNGRTLIITTNNNNNNKTPTDPAPQEEKGNKNRDNPSNMMMPREPERVAAMF